MTVSGLALGGADPGDFSETNNCGTTLVAGAECGIFVTFLPTATGTRSATLTATDNASDSPQTVTLSGMGVQRLINMSPAGLTFGKVIEYNESPPQTITLSNASGSAVTFSNLGVSGQYFLMSGNTCGTGLAAGATCTVTIHPRINKGT
jgi:hypothetical protein